MSCAGRDRPPPGPAAAAAQQKYDLLLKGGHVIDPRNRISAVRDVAIANGKVAAVAARIDPAEALKVVDVSGLYVTPGLIDIHVHVFAGTGERGSYAGDNSVYPDGFTLRSGVTTVADTGSSGWRNFEDFKQRIIDRSKTRVLALPQHRRPRHARRQVRAGPGRHGSEADGRHGASLQGRDRRRQDRALRRPGVGAGRAGGRGGHDREHSGHGRLRHQSPGAPDERARDEEAPAGRHLHARVFRAARRAGRVRTA